MKIYYSKCQITIKMIHLCYGCIKLNIDKFFFRNINKGQETNFQTVNNEYVCSKTLIEKKLSLIN